MFKEALYQIKTACMLLIFLTLLTGLLYPLAVTAIAHLFFPWQANGSLIEKEGQYVGSLLIGQYFTSPTFFWGRPSATQPFPYNGAASLGSNQGPSNPVFLSTVQERVYHLIHSQSENKAQIPVDLVTASGSGLDPEISLFAALYQVSRIAKARNISQQDIRSLVEHHVKGRTFELLGEPRVNVLELNLALEKLR